MEASTIASKVPCTSPATKPGKSISLTSAPVRCASASVAGGLGTGAGAGAAAAPAGSANALERAPPCTGGGKIERVRDGVMADPLRASLPAAVQVVAAVADQAQLGAGRHVAVGRAAEVDVDREPEG